MNANQQESSGGNAEGRGSQRDTDGWSEDRMYPQQTTAGRQAEQKTHNGTIG